jgi:hypothetical protein
MGAAASPMEKIAAANALIKSMDFRARIQGLYSSTKVTLDDEGGLTLATLRALLARKAEAEARRAGSAAAPGRVLRTPRGRGRDERNRGTRYEMIGRRRHHRRCPLALDEQPVLEGGRRGCEIPALGVFTNNADFPVWSAYKLAMRSCTEKMAQRMEVTSP